MFFYVCYLIEDFVKVVKVGKRIVNVVLRWYFRVMVLLVMLLFVFWVICVLIVVKICKEIFCEFVIESERVGEWIFVESIYLEVICILFFVRFF